MAVSANQIFLNFLDIEDQLYNSLEYNILSFIGSSRTIVQGLATLDVLVSLFLEYVLYKCAM